MIFLAILGFGLWGFIGKIGIESLGKEQYLCLSYLTTAAIISGLFILGRDRSMIFSTNLLYPLIGGSCVALAVVGFFTAIERLPLSIVSPVVAIYPVITVALAMVIFAEKLTLVQGIGVILALIGVILLGLPSH